MFKRLTTSLVNQTSRIALIRTCAFSTHVNPSLFSLSSTSSFSSYLPKRFAAGETQANGGKKAFSDFLQSEISEEVKKDSKPKAPAGWDVKADSAYCTFRKTFSDGNSIEISFSVSATVQAAAAPTPDAADKEMPLESLPPFQIRIFKPSGRVLELNCSFVEPDEDVQDLEEAGQVVKDSERRAQKQQQPEAPTFSIDTVALKSRGQLATTTGRSFNLSIPFADHEYYVEQDVLDEVLLDHLYAFLGERGVDESFAAELVRFSSCHEHQLYVQFLRSLREFVNE